MGQPTQTQSQPTPWGQLLRGPRRDRPRASRHGSLHRRMQTAGCARGERKRLYALRCKWTSMRGPRLAGSPRAVRKRIRCVSALARRFARRDRAAPPAAKGGGSSRLASGAPALTQTLPLASKKLCPERWERARRAIGRSGPQNLGDGPLTSRRPNRILQRSKSSFHLPVYLPDEWDWQP
jgi:hypothetical protein